jgi:DNA (cytosine-5)-methyltransferase 1
MPDALRRDWIWWSLPAPPPRNAAFIDLLEDNPPDVEWHSSRQTADLVAMMSEAHLAKLQQAVRAEGKVAGTLYRRTRLDRSGHKVQRAEDRFDGVAGCLRTPGGGSSRQFVLLVEGPSIRSRLLSARETARLMGLPDTYQLPDNYTEAYHLTGDGVVVPVIRHLAENLFEPLLRQRSLKGCPNPESRSAHRMRRLHLR